MVNENVQLAASLMRQVDTGVLSTISAEIEGYPFGSITPFVCSHEGRPIVYVSNIAQHTHNMIADPRSCLTVMAEAKASTNQQALGRATLVGNATPVPDQSLPSARQRYFAAFPDAEEYSETHSFTFYWIDPLRIRYIGGFGKIFWIEKDDWLRDLPSFAGDEKKIVSHMNDDHEDALRAMVQVHLGVAPKSAKILTVDSDAFQVRTDLGLHSIDLGTACTTTEDVHKAMVQLARKARAELQA